MKKNTPDEEPYVPIPTIPIPPGSPLPKPIIPTKQKKSQKRKSRQ